MKKITKQFLGLALVGLILGGCSQTATFEDADLMNEQAAAEKGGFNLNPFGMGTENALLSDAPCINGSSGIAFAQDFSENYNNNFSASIKVYNTLTHIVYQFSGSYNCIKLGNFNGSVITLDANNEYKVPLSNWKHGDLRNQNFWVGRNGCNGIGNGQAVSISTSYNLIGICTNTTLSEGTVEPICEKTPFSLTASVAADGDFTGGTIQILDSNNSVVASEPVTSENKSVVYNVPTGTAGSYTFSAKYVPSNTNGYKSSISSTSTVEVITCSTCDGESFKYNAEYAGEGDLVDIIFTYDAPAPLINAQVKFTFPQIKNESTGGVYTAPDGKEYSVNSDKNNTVFTWIGNIGCTDATATTFKFQVEAICNPSGKAQIWTSASVNGEEIKNENTPNIRFWCATNTIEKTNDE